MNIDKETLLKTLRAAPFEGLRSHELAAAMAAAVTGRHRRRTVLDTLVDDQVLEKAPGNRYRIIGATPPATPTGKELPKGWFAGSLRVHPAGYRFLAPRRGEG